MMNLLLRALIAMSLSVAAFCAQALSSNYSATSTWAYNGAPGTPKTFYLTLFPNDGGPLPSGTVSFSGSGPNCTNCGAGPTTLSSGTAISQSYDSTFTSVTATYSGDSYYQGGTFTLSLNGSGANANGTALEYQGPYSYPEWPPESQSMKMGVYNFGNSTTGGLSFNPSATGTVLFVNNQKIAYGPPQPVINGYATSAPIQVGDQPGEGIIALYSGDQNNLPGSGNVTYSLTGSAPVPASPWWMLGGLSFGVLYILRRHKALLK